MAIKAIVLLMKEIWKTIHFCREIVKNNTGYKVVLDWQTIYAKTAKCIPRLCRCNMAKPIFVPFSIRNQTKRHKNILAIAQKRICGNF